jgi:hypothetical protein
MVLKWKKATKSNPSGNCVEVAFNDGVHVRNSRNILSKLDFTKDEWDAFIDGVKNGEFDRA